MSFFFSDPKDVCGKSFLQACVDEWVDPPVTKCMLPFDGEPDAMTDSIVFPTYDDNGDLM